jgi:hypothetical protein
MFAPVAPPTRAVILVSSDATLPDLVNRGCVAGTEPEFASSVPSLAGWIDLG